MCCKRNHIYRHLGSRSKWTTLWNSCRKDVAGLTLYCTKFVLNVRWWDNGRLSKHLLFFFKLTFYEVLYIDRKLILIRIYHCITVYHTIILGPWPTFRKFDRRLLTCHLKVYEWYKNAEIRKEIVTICCKSNTGFTFNNFTITDPNLPVTYFLIIRPNLIITSKYAGKLQYYQNWT